MVMSISKVVSAASKAFGPLLLATGVSLIAGSTQALTLNGTSGSFSNAVGGSNINLDQPGTILWGIPPSGAQSGLRFDGSGSSDPLPLDIAFALGALTHFNNPVFVGTGATAVDLDIALDFAGSGLTTFNYTLNIDETLNDAASCVVPGITVCPDIIDFEPTVGTQTFMNGGIEYELELLGFRSELTGEVMTQFISEENQSNNALLYGRITQISDPVTEVPTPAAVLPIISGMLGAASRSKKQSKND